MFVVAPAVATWAVGAEIGVGLAAAFGTELAVGSALATAIGGAVISGGVSLLQGKSIGDSFKNAVIGGAVSYVGGSIGAEVSSQVSSAASSEFGSEFAKNAGKLAGNVAKGEFNSLVTGRSYDPLQALVTGGIGMGVDSLTSQIEGFDQMPASMRNLVSSTIKNSLSQSTASGKPATAETVQAAKAAGEAAAKSYKPDVVQDLQVAGLQTTEKPQTQNEFMAQNFGSAPAAPTVAAQKATMGQVLENPYSVVAGGNFSGVSDTDQTSILNDPFTSNTVKSVQASGGGSIDDLMHYLKG
jgi:hypothetical protein